MSKTDLTTVIIPEGATSIPNSAFEGCKGLISVVIPSSVTSIKSAAFYNCLGLKEVHISDVAAWCAITFSYYTANPLYYAQNLYLNGELVTNLVIPEGVTSIGDYAFCDCSSLTSVTIPESVTSIGDLAFPWCESLTSVTIPSSVTSIGWRAFFGCSKLSVFYFLGNPPEITTESFPSATGYYHPINADRWSRVIDEAGKWNEFPMSVMTFNTVEGALEVMPFSPFGKVRIAYKGERLSDMFRVLCRDDASGKVYLAKSLTRVADSDESVIFEWDMVKDGIRLDMAQVTFWLEWQE